MFRNQINYIESQQNKIVQKKRSERRKQLFKVRMETEFVSVNNIYLRVDSWGGYLPSNILQGSQDKPYELILMIPGNPGITKFYERFLSHLYESTKKPIWILSHGGHDHVKRKIPSLKNHKNLYNLQGQIDQKEKFIETYLSGVKLYCIGHSIGCKMILELFKRKNKESENIEKCLLLFPTLERMAETPNGANLIFVLKYILWLAIFGSWIFVYLPKVVGVFLIRVYCLVTGIPPFNMPAMLKLVDPHILSHVFFLADDEMEKVRDLDDEILISHGHKLKLYYSATDGWTPLKFYTQLKEKHKNVNAEVCSYEHTFVLKESEEVADLAYKWLTT